MLYSFRKAVALGESQEAEDQETVLDLHCSEKHPLRPGSRFSGRDAETQHSSP